MDLSTIPDGVTPLAAPGMETESLDPRYIDWFKDDKQVGGGYFVSRLYRKMAGEDLHAAIMLGQLAYWFGPGENGQPRVRIKRNGYYWLVRRRQDWQEELGLSPKQADRALRVLRDLGLIETMVAKFGLDPTSHIRILWPRFLDERERLSKELAAATPEPKPRSKKAPAPAPEGNSHRPERERTSSHPTGNPVITQRARTKPPLREEPKPDTTCIDYEQNLSQEAFAVEEGFRSSSNSLSEHQQTRDSDGRSAPAESPTPPGAGESSGTAFKDLKSQGQKPAPRAGKRESDTSPVSSAKALALKDADLSPRARETLTAALERQTELKGAANVPHTRLRLLALRGADEAAWIALLSHSTLHARTCVASFAETHAKRPAGAGSSLADDAAAKKREINRSGSYARRGVFVEDGAPRDLSDPKIAAREARRLARYKIREEAKRNHPDDSYVQFGVRITCGTRPNVKGPSLDIRRSEKGLPYELLPGERTSDKFADAYFHSPHVDSDTPCGIAERDILHARMDCDPERTARARRNRESLEWLYDASASSV